MEFATPDKLVSTEVADNSECLYSCDFQFTHLWILVHRMVPHIVDRSFLIT